MATIKQKQAFKEIGENGGNVSKGMRAVKYSKHTAKTPQKLTESKGWKELMEKHLPDKLLAKVHQEGLEAAKRITINGKDLGIEEPDYGVRHKYLDSAYKLKGSYAAEKTDVTSGGQTLTELLGAIKKKNESGSDGKN